MIEEISSVFSGFGGFEKGIMLSDFKESKVVYACDIDKFARKSYQALYNQVPKGDIYTSLEKKEIPKHDLLVGGFPCQPFSVAGKQLGLNEDRGVLFKTIVEIAKTQNPSFLLLENVKGLVNHDNGRTLKIILEELNQADYYVSFELLNTLDYTLPQHRERIYFLAIHKDVLAHLPFKIEPLAFTNDKLVIDKAKKMAKENNIKTFRFDWDMGDRGKMKPLAAIEEKHPPLSYYLTEARNEKLLKETRLYIEEMKKDFYKNKEKIVKLEKLFNLTKNETVFIRLNKYHILDIAHYSTCLNARDYKGLSRQPMTGVIHKLKDDTLRIRLLTPLESMKLQGFNQEDYQKLVDAKLSRTQIIKQAGNAVTAPVVASILNKLYEYLPKSQD